jgi:TRAP-type C4-dicarboxylate transport system permease small subunit
MKELLSRTPSPETVSVASFWQSLSAFASSFLKLVVLEARQAATGVALMLAFALGAAALIVTAWLALIAWVIALFVQSGVLGWAAGFFVAAILSVGGAAVLVFLLLRRAKSVRFEATRRQLAGESPEEGDYERTA